MSDLRQQPLAPEELRQQLVRSCAMLGIGLALVPEPEVLQATMASIKCETLAGLITKLIAEHEPCLRASADGAEVVVRELGDGTLMRFTVEAL